MIGLDVDVSAVLRALNALAAGLDRTGPRTAMVQAVRTAGDVRGRVPVRTGRLASTVGPVRIPGGAGVTYGGTLPYDRYIERRAHAVERGIAGAPEQFHRLMTAAAEAEVARL